MYLSDFLLKDKNIVVLSGVNSSGSPIFKNFIDQFSNFSEQDFENFWKIYFIALIYEHFIKEEKFREKLSLCDNEIKKFKQECSIAGIPEIPEKQDRKNLIGWILGDGIKKIGVKIEPNTNTFTPEIEFKESTIKSSRENKKSLYIDKIGKALETLLLKSGFKIWIVLDRLDEVFDRYTAIEFKGLRGLLMAYKSFDIGKNDNLIRVKIFLRDDIINFLTDAQFYKTLFPGKEMPPLAAATHILSRQSPTLSWTEDEIEQLVLNRLILSSTDLRDHLSIPYKFQKENDYEFSTRIKESMREKDVRKSYWNKIFPVRIQTQASLKWIFSHLKDSNDIVTPRSVIDMLEGALDYQKKKLRTDFGDTTMIFSLESLKAGLEMASKNKLIKDIYNEFPKEQEYIKALEKFGKHKLSPAQLETLYGKNWEGIALGLGRIGILKFVKNSRDYRIVFLFRPALNITYVY